MATTEKTTNFSDIVAAFLERIPKREAEVLMKRNALNDYPKHTLEEIGRSYNITRERVRQIENEGIKKVSAIDFEKECIPVDPLLSTIASHLKAHGGIIAENHLVEKILEQREDARQELNALNFLLNHILSQKYSRHTPETDHDVVWIAEGEDADLLLGISSTLHKLINEHQEPITISELIEAFKSNNHFPVVDQKPAQNESIIEALLRAHNEIGKNILNQWGIRSWKTITPKRMTDKAYLILKREGRPLHFEEITNLINEAHFDHKRACPATVHNELILDDKYVLVGRGLYALREHGYTEGTVADIIGNLLKERGAMDKKAIADEVLKQRFVQKTTITLALMKKDKFKRLDDGMYDLA